VTDGKKPSLGIYGKEKEKRNLKEGSSKHVKLPEIS
jgi:hypothetical protein